MSPTEVTSDPAFVTGATVTVTDVSVWFGQVVALSGLSCSFGPGVTGLLGPNGAGKTTLLRALTGMIDPNQGSVSVWGLDPRRDRSAFTRLALVPEDEAVPPMVSARQLISYVAALHRVRDGKAVEWALATVELTDVADRRVDGFSKGMRQRVKVACALVTNPAVLVLDEPLNGADPVQRAHLIDLFRRLGDEGRTVIVSSHILAEVERFADRIVVVTRGRLAAAGNQRAIREAMDDRPRHVLVRADRQRDLAAALIGLDATEGVTVEDDHLVVSTRRTGDLAVALPRLARERSIRLHEVRALDDSLEGLFRELVR